MTEPCRKFFHWKRWGLQAQMVERTFPKKVRLTCRARNQNLRYRLCRQLRRGQVDTLFLLFIPFKFICLPLFPDHLVYHHPAIFNPEAHMDYLGGFET